MRYCIIWKLCCFCFLRNRWGCLYCCGFAEPCGWKDVIQYVEWLYAGFIPYAHIHSTEKRRKAFVGNLRFCNLWKKLCPRIKRSLVWVPFLSGYSDVAWTHNLLIEKGSQVLQMAHKSHFCFFLVIIFVVPCPTDSTERFLHVDQKRSEKQVLFRIFSEKERRKYSEEICFCDTNVKTMGYTEISKFKNQSDYGW